MERYHNFKKTKDYFIAVDSDGSVFDTMELKQKECFAPNTIKHWGLQPIARYAREAWEFVNLYSRHRGINRFRAILIVANMLKQKPEVQRRGFDFPDLAPLEDWVENAEVLDEIRLEKAIRLSGDPVLKKAFAWSRAINICIDEMVKGVAPFAGVGEFLKRASGKADIMVCSGTPFKAIQREWAEHGIEKYVSALACQEMGRKAGHLCFAAAGKYDKDRMLMIGDSYGDWEAAKQNRALFFPVLPGREEESWREFNENGMNLFFEGAFEGEYQDRLLERFEKALPDLDAAGWTADQLNVPR